MKQIPRKLANVRTLDMAYGTREVVDFALWGSDANVVTSIVGDLHSPVLDIDFPARLIPSSTEGHFHLYLDKTMTWRKYRRLLKALGRAGILEPGYVKASCRRRFTAVRLPGVRKASA